MVKTWKCLFMKWTKIGILKLDNPQCPWAADGWKKNPAALTKDQFALPKAHNKPKVKMLS